MKLAIIDLGTNTCNLLVAELTAKGYSILHQSKQIVRLGDGKISENEISSEALQRTIDSFRIHKNIIGKFGVEKVRVIATSAVRSAANKIQFLEEMSENSGWLVKVVSGEKEAELIFKGVLLAFGRFENPSVILDIGGGSNELILAHDKSMLWKESQPTGMARIINRFSISDPILPSEEKEIRDYFSEMHHEAFQTMKKAGVKTLVGCSGAFDTIADMIDSVDPGTKSRQTQEIKTEDFSKVFSVLIISTKQQRLTMKGMDMVRVDLIVPAMIFIDQLIKEIGITRIIQTDFALREGVLSEICSDTAQTGKVN